MQPPLVFIERWVNNDHASRVVDSDSICLQVTHVLLKPCPSDCHRLSLVDEHVTIEAYVVLEVAIDDRHATYVAQVQQIEGLSDAI
jgi:hypothetical protein